MIVLLAIALGMDAFSLGIGLGLQKISWKNIFKISITIGIFHIIMPLVGLVSGKYLATYVGNIAEPIGGIILVILGSNMLWSAVIGVKNNKLDYSNLFGLILIAFSVSIDALSTGFSLGLNSLSLCSVIFIFGFFGTVMSGLGLYLGNKINILAGDYGEIFGGIVLIIIGIKFLV